MLSLDAQSLSIQKFYEGDPNIPNGWQTVSRFDLSPLFGGSLFADAIATNTAPHVTHVSKSIFEQDLHVKGNLSCDGSLPSPFWVAGRVNGLGGTVILTSKGRYQIGFQRLQAGLYKITWDPPHPDDGNFVVFAQGEGTGGAWQILHDINDANRNTSTSVTFTVRNNNFSTVDGIVNFGVLA